MSADKRFPGLGTSLGVGLELAGAVAGLALVGYWIDRHYGTDPWGLVVGVILGLVGGLYNFVRNAKRYEAQAREREQERPRRRMMP